jgi:hypothetical protein
MADGFFFGSKSSPSDFEEVYTVEVFGGSGKEHYPDHLAYTGNLPPITTEHYRGTAGGSKVLTEYEKYSGNLPVLSKQFHRGRGTSCRFGASPHEPRRQPVRRACRVWRARARLGGAHRPLQSRQVLLAHAAQGACASGVPPLAGTPALPLAVAAMPSARRGCTTASPTALLLCLPCARRCAGAQQHAPRGGR